MTMHRTPEPVGSKHLTPLQVCERLVGPIEALGPIAGLGEKAAYHWRQPSRIRDAGDIPSKAMRAILSHAAARELPLTEAHMIWGAPEAEVVQLLENLDLRQIRAAG
ncbi:hypothetical protein [Marinovum algicola]|uniref:hypothetical protein n=1 Tax=Marinovum algicola TaxID=42444 RepID=UPI003B52AEA9